MNPAPSAPRDGGPLVLAMLCIAGFVAALSFFAPSPFYPEIAGDLGTSVSVLGQSATLLMVVSSVLGLAVGPIGDAYGYRRLLVFGVCAIAAYQLGFALSPSLVSVLAVTLLGAIGDALVFGLALALASVLFEGPSRKRALSWTIASLSAGAIAGVPFVTLIGDLTNWRVAIGVFGAACLAFAWVLLVVLPDDHRLPGQRIRMRDIAAAYLPILSDPPTVRLLGMTVARATWILGWVTYAGAYAGDELGLSTRNVGFMYMLGGMGATAGSLLAGSRLLGRFPRTVVAVASLAGGTLFLVFILSSSLVVVLVVSPVVAALSSIASVGIASLLAAESQGQAGTTMSLNATLINVGGSLGAAVGGVLLALGGYAAFGIGLSMFTVAAAMLAWWPRRSATIAVQAGRI